MKLYIGVIDDPRSGIDVKGFLRRCEAVEYAAEPTLDACKEFGKKPEYQRINDSMCHDGWVYYVKSYDDGPSGWVVEQEL